MGEVIVSFAKKVKNVVPVVVNNTIGFLTHHQENFFHDVAEYIRYLLDEFTHSEDKDAAKENLLEFVYSLKKLSFASYQDKLLIYFDGHYLSQEDIEELNFYVIR